MTTSTLTEITTHSWEKHGYKAPYRCVGVYSIPSPSLAEQNPAAYILQIQESPKGYSCGICNVCGMSLINNYLMNDADGVKFVVGCDCVEKTGDYKVIRQMKGYKRDFEVNRRIAKKTAETKARLNKERELNGGLTNDEVIAKARQEERDAFYALHAEFFDKVKATENSFALDVLQSVVHFKNMSLRQEEILQLAIVEHEKSLSAKNEYFGNIGDKITVELTTKNILAFPSQYGVTYICILTDSEGRTFKYSGSAVHNIPNKGDTAKLKFTISSHVKYEDTLQTVIQRVKMID